MNPLYMILIAIIIVIVLFIILKMYMKKIANRDLNRLLLRKKNIKNYYFFNEKTHKIYMINTETGQLYYCLTDKTVNQNTFRRVTQDLKYTKTTVDYTIISENYYKIIEKDIDFDIESLQ